MAWSRSVQWVGTILVAVAPAFLTGCAGRADISAIPFSRSDLRDQDSLVTRLPTASRCAWYVDKAGQLIIAMKYENLPLFGKFAKAQWTTRIRLGEPPAGRSLKYNLYRDQVRGICSSGIEHWRFQTRWGVLVLDRLSGDRFRGRFHIAVAQQQFTLFGGWAPTGFAAPLLIMWGEFEAIHDARFAEALAATIDNERWGDLAGYPATRAIQIRPPTPTTRPAATRPVTRPAPSSSR